MNIPKTDTLPYERQALKKENVLLFPELKKEIHRIINTISQDIPKVRFENEEMDSIWDVSADSLEQQGRICYMNCCVGQTLFFIHKLKEILPANNIWLWIEHLYLPEEDNSQNFHFFVEIDINWGRYILDFSHDHIVYFYQWTYKNRWKHSITSNFINVIPSTLIAHTDSIFDIWRKVGMPVEEYRVALSQHLAKLKQDNTLEQWEDFDKKRNKPLTLVDGEFSLEDIQDYLKEGFSEMNISKLHISPSTKHNIEAHRLVLHALLQQNTPENKRRVSDYLINWHRLQS